MPSVAVLAADGFETIECLTMVDVMRRGGVRATLVSIMPTREVVSCAAPFILGELDLLEGRHATCFPGFEKSFPEGAYTGEKVTQDGNIITASGMAQSLPFALELLRTLAGDKAVEKVAEGIQL